MLLPQAARVSANDWNNLRSNMRGRRFCATLFRAARNLLILNGEMSEWLKEHAWKLIPSARAEAHQISPTHFRSTTSRNNDARQHARVNHRVDQGFRGACDTVLTQKRFRLLRLSFLVDDQRRLLPLRDGRHRSAIESSEELDERR
jgi:hypothetical protein